MTAPIVVPVDAWRLLWRWRTDVLIAADGTEQRASTSALPRTFMAATANLTDAQRLALHAAIVGAPDATVPVAQPHEGTPTTAAVTGAAAVVDDTYCDWIAAGRRVLVVGAGGVSFTTTISSFTGGSLTLGAGPSSGTYPAGVTMVYPCEEVYLDDGQEVTRAPVNLSRWRLAGRQQTAAALTGTGGAAVTTYESLPVLVDRPLAGTSDGETYRTGIEFADAGGAPSASTIWTYGRRQRSGSWMITTPAQRQTWKVWLSTVRGRWKPFLAPTWRPDFTLYTQPSAGGTTVRVNEEVSGAWADTVTRLQLEYADGSVSYRTIDTTSWTGTYTQFTLTASLPGTIPGGSVRTVSLLEECRLDTDDVTIEYRGDWIGRVTLPMVAL